MSILDVLECLIMIGIGSLMIANPRLFYELKESWKHNGDSEPSNFWIFSTRVGGAAFLLVGIGGIVLTLIGII